MRTNKPLTVTLGKQQAEVERRVASGRYSSASEVLRAGLRALDREEAALDQVMREKIAIALADSRPDVPAKDVFERLRAHHNDQVKARSRDA